MSNQSVKAGGIIPNSIPGIQKIYKTIDCVYPTACLNKTFKIRRASFKDHLCLGRNKKHKNRNNSEALYIVTKNYRVTYDYTFDNGKKGNDEVIVPALMCTDLATIPTRLLRFLLGIGRVGPHLEATIVHDFLYIAWQLFAHQGANPKQHARKEYKAFADNLCYCLLKASRVGCVKKVLMYVGMRIPFIAWWYFGGKDTNIGIPKNQNPCPCP